PEYGTDQVLALGAVVLLAAAAGVALVERVWLPAAALVAGAAAGVFAVGALAPDTTGQRLEGLAAKNWSPLYRAREARTPRKLDPAEVAEAVGTGFTVREAQDTRYHRLVVVDGGGSRYLRFDSSFQSGMYIGQPFRTRFAYTDYLQLGLAYNPSAKNVLVVGLGGASAPKRVWRDFGDVRLTVVELDPAVVETAYKWFALPHDERIDVHVDDGRRYLQRNDDRYDVIMLDAFYADGVPFHMTTLEFVELLRKRLAHHPRALEDVCVRVPHGRLPPGLRRRVRPHAERRPEHHPRRHGARRAEPRPARGDVGGGQTHPRPAGADAREPDPEPLGATGPGRRRAAPHGRLR